MDLTSAAPAAPAGFANVAYGTGSGPTPRTIQPSAAALAAHADLPGSIAARLDASLLTPRIDGEPLSDGLARSIRFTIDGDGPMSQRRFVPETATAKRLFASSAGPKIERIMRGYLAGADGMEGVTKLRGIVLAPDEASVRANEVLSAWHRTLDAHPDAHLGLYASDEAAADSMVSGLAEHLTGDDVKLAGAWTRDGWITFLPKAAHVMLAAANANTIDLTDRPGGEPKLLERTVDWARNIGTHEVQHAITPADGRTLSVPWEEGTAEVIANSISELQAQRTGLTADNYRTALATPDEFDPHWKPFVDPPRHPREAERNVRIREIYQWPERALRALLTDAGIADPTTPAGWSAARDLLQGAGDDTPQQRMAAAIATAHHVAPDTARQLLPLVKASVDFTQGATSLQKISDLIGGTPGAPAGS
jgi:hypothetical protein